jgi:hypothetical protein
MELRQSSFVSSILPSIQTKWKFWAIRTLRSRCDPVLEGAFVDFVFVAMIDVVEQVKVLLVISNIGMFFS